MIITKLMIERNFRVSRNIKKIQEGINASLISDEKIKKMMKDIEKEKELCKNLMQQNARKIKKILKRNIPLAKFLTNSNLYEII